MKNTVIIALLALLFIGCEKLPIDPWGEGGSKHHNRELLKNGSFHHKGWGWTVHAPAYPHTAKVEFKRGEAQYIMGSSTDPIHIAHRYPLDSGQTYILKVTTEAIAALAFQLRIDEVNAGADTLVQTLDNGYTGGVIIDTFQCSKDGNRISLLFARAFSPLPADTLSIYKVSLKRL